MNQIGLMIIHNVAIRQLWYQMLHEKKGLIRFVSILSILNGGPRRDRTADTGIFSAVLCQLSYRAMTFWRFDIISREQLKCKRKNDDILQKIIFGNSIY